MSTLDELLRRSASGARGDRRITIVDGRTLTTAELLDEAERAAAGIVDVAGDGNVSGRPVLLLMRDSEDWLVTFWGALLAGALPTAAAGPRDASSREVERIQRAIAALGEPVVIVERGFGAIAGARLGYACCADAGDVRGSSRRFSVRGSDVAFLQMSSGSTREPRPVMLTHENVLASLAQLAAALPLGADDVNLSWMPLFHDMGLVGGHLASMHIGMREVRMDAASAMSDPMRWLEVAAGERASVLSSTCLGLERATRAIARRGSAPDLSSVRLLATGAEPVQPRVLRDFSRAAGVDERVHFPMYGMAEAVVGVSAPRVGGVRVAVVDGVERPLLGPALPGVEVRIASDTGELEVRGPNVTRGYRRADGSVDDGELFTGDGWLRTGDLGSVVDGELVIVGRRKDIVIVDGRNVHASDIEALAESVDGIKSAIFVADSRAQPERPTLAVVVDGAAWLALAGVRAAVAGEIGVEPRVIVLEKLPRTTSGKKRRLEIKARVELGELDDTGPHASTLALVRDAWQSALGRAVDDDNAAFRDVGGTSIAAVRVLAFLSERGVRADHRLLLRGDTMRALARVLEEGGGAVVDEPVRTARESSEPIAIVSLALRVPGARGPRSLFALASAGVTRIGPGKRGLTSTGAYLDDDPALFDADSFGIPATEADAMDPQQRLMLTVAREALARAAVDDESKRECGVFVGAGQQAYLEHVLPRVDDVAAAALPGNLLSMIAARVAHVFDLRGPALTVDTACSSSLVALHLACRSLRSGECRVAVVGGVHLTLSDTLSTLFARAGALSPTGKCTPFVDGADGTVPGEGAVAVVVAPLSVAEERGWPVLGVVYASAINNDGASLGVMAPNPAGQERVIRRCVSSANVELTARVVVVEAHGTGTPVGDEVERAVLRRTYPHGPRVTATKALVGHLMAAAGLAGLARLLGELKAGDVGAISSFGFGGTNAHCIVEGAWRRVPDDALDDGAVPKTRHWLRESAPRVYAGLREGAVVVVTGATGALGTALVRALAPLRVRALLVGSRTDAQALVDVVAAAGGQARYCSADLTTSAGCARVRRAARDFAPAGVDVLFHLAGALEPGRAKALKLDALLRLEPIAPRAMVLSSSIAAQRAEYARGIEGYADANRALDEYARAAPPEAHVVSVALPALRGGLALPVLAALEERGVPVVDVDEGARMLLDAARATPIPVRATAIALTDDVDARLRALVGAAIGKEPGAIDAHATFASLGLDSLAAVDVTKGLEDLVGRELPITFLYEHDTIARALSAIAAQRSRAGGTPAPLHWGGAPAPRHWGGDRGGAPAPRHWGGDRGGAPAPLHRGGDWGGAPAPRHWGGDRGGGGGDWGGTPVHPQSSAAGVPPAQPRLAPGLPLAPSQLAFVAQRSLFPDMAGNVFLAVDVDDGTGPLTDDELRLALATLVERHPALAALITRSREQAPGPPPELRRVDAVDEDALADEVFDLERGPLFRVITDGRRLVLNGHHAVVDAWSVRNVLLELLELIAARRASRAPDLPPLTSTLTEAYQALLQPAPPQQLAWWTAQLSSAPPLHLPWRAPVDAPSSGGAACSCRVIDADQSAAIRERAAAAGVTLPAWMLASWMRALFDASGQHDVVVRVAQGRRTARIPGFDKLVGAFADALPIRARIALDDDTASFAKRVQAFLVDAQARGDVSSQALADALPRGAAGPIGISPVGFSFPLLPSGARIAGFTVDDVVGRAAAGFSRATLVAFFASDRLHLSLSHARSHVDTALAERLLASTVRHALDAPQPAPAATLHSRILERCRAHPERVAVEGVTYGALAGRSAALANRLAPHIDERKRIAVFAEPSADAVVAVLAVMRAGCAYVPLDPHWPDGRVVDVVGVAQPSAIVCTRGGAERARVHGLPVVVVDESEAASGPDVSDARLAYVMFTSGSTGKPKGVAVSHAPCLAFQEWVRRAFDVDDGARFAQTSSLAFGGSIRQMFSALLAGASIHPVTHELLRDPDALIRFLHDERITIWNSVPSLWLHLMDAAERSPIARPFEHLRTVLIGGEPVPAAQARRWRDIERRQCTSSRLFNLYGSVETIVNATWFEVVRDPADDELHVPIGWPRAGCDVALDDVDVGAVGEIVVTGAIADGYIGSDSFGGTYRTGDLGKRQPDGSFVHMGRRDGQVQVHGNRVELVEIEHALAAHPSVRRAACAWTGRALVASVEVAGDVDGSALRTFLASKLPAYMVPHRIDVVGALPRTPAGKVDRRALAGADTDIFGALSNAWQRVLELRDRPGDDDDFFALGGDSIRAIEVLDELRKTLPGAERLRPMALYRHRRFRDLAQAIAAALVDVAPAVQRADARRQLSTVQRGFYLAQQLTGRSPTWAALVPLEDALADDECARAVALLVERHAMLRTTFAPDARGTVVATQHQSAPVAVVVEDLRSLSASARESRLVALFDDAAARSFDPARLPLFSLRLVHVDERHSAILFSSHHMISDAWSCFALFSELADVVAGRALPPLTSTFTQVSMRDRTRPTVAEERYWRAALADLTQQPAPPPSTTSHARVLISRQATHAIARRARGARTTPFAVVLQAFAEELGCADGVVSVAVAGRDSAVDDAARIVGPFARGLPVRMRSLGLRDVAASLDDAIAHADAPAATIALAAGDDALAKLGRYFLSWLDPAALSSSSSSLQARWADARFRFDTSSTHTEVMIGAVPTEDGLVLHVHGSERAAAVAAGIKRRLEHPDVDAALVVYAPAGFALPVREPVVVETVRCALGTSQLVLLPLPADALASTRDLDVRIARALACTDARVVSLAGMLPSLMGLGLRDVDERVTTGHAATVAAMFLTIQRALDAAGADFADCNVASVGYGSIGRSTWELVVEELGQPRSHIVIDPALSSSAPAQSLAECDLIIAASSAGNCVDVGALTPGCIVVDDSFPRAFDDDAAWSRMRTRKDVLLVGGGMLDAGPLERTSPFPQADAIRATLPVQWLPGCHAEALVISARPSLGVTRGFVDVARSRAMLHALLELGLRAAPLHLGRDEIGDDVVAGVLAARPR